MRLTLDIRPDLAAMMAAEIAAGERAVTAAVREAGAGLKLGWRGQITGAGLGARLANSIRSEVFPKAGASLNAAAVVWSKAPVIIGAHDAGPLIRARNGLWLAIPTPAAGKALGGRRDHAGGMGAEDRAAGCGSSIGGPGRACSWRRRSPRGKTVAAAPVFLLVPQVKLPKRLDLARDAERHTTRCRG